MTKKDFIKLLEPFDDNAELSVFDEQLGGLAPIASVIMKPSGQKDLPPQAIICLG